MLESVKKSIISLILIALSAQLIFCQTKASRQVAFDSFSTGNYSKAYTQFNELLSAYPKDPLYKYYSAVCLLNLEKDPAEAESLLNQALASPVKSLPVKARFWLARSQQMQGKYQEAEKTFRRFSADAGRKEVKRLNVQDYIRQCKNESGAILIASSARVSEKAVNANADPTMKESSTVKSQVKEDIPADLDKKLGQALEQEYNAGPSGQNAEIKQPEKPAAPNPVVAKENASTLESKETDTLQKSVQGKNDIKTKVIKQEPVLTTSDAGKASSPQKVVPVQENRPLKDSTIRDQKEESTGVFSVFEILPAPVTDPKVGIEIDPEVPKGLVYRIQLAVFKNPVQLAYFKGISPICGFKSQTSTIYYAGMFRRLADAEKARVAVRAKGFREAFVAAQMDGKKVSAERAAVLEKEWGKIPLFSYSYEQKNQLDTLPPTLVYRVEAVRTKQPLTNESVEAMKRIAGNRGLDIQRSSDGSLVYLIGNFITFESARDYAGLLIRNGYRDAKVVARLGKKEIDIETAKQLFDTLK
jgi:tetratricopeptide (TPR) repeat protein